mgnify:CR=1 FL=1
MSTEALLPFPQFPIAPILLWAGLASVLLYLARDSSHRLILSLARILHNGFRLAARSVRLAERRLVQRNREVLLTLGAEASERMVARELERVDAAVQRDLSEYPALQRRLLERVTALEEDYQRSTEVPPEPPGWTKAVATIAKVPSAGDPTVAKVMESIQESLSKAEKRALDEYRKSSHERHRLLKSMMPHWRRVQQALSEVDKRVSSLLQRARTIDRHMDEYREIAGGTDQAVRLLSSSSLTQFFISTFVLAIAVGGAVINFNLISRPMQEMVGGNTYLMGFQTANIAALVIILVEVAMGLFLMESLRVTRLFPVIGALDDKMRVRMIWFTFAMLLVMASIESGLAYMRELLSQDDAALVAGLLSNAGAGVDAGSNRWITTAAQMGMGFVLPFALTFVAIPLESFIHSSRTVLGVAAAGALRVLAVVLRLFGSLAHYSGTALVNLYDLVIFIPVGIERQFKAHRRRSVPRNGGPVQMASGGE